MKTLTATLRLYKEAFLDAARAMPRSWPAMLGLTIYSVVLVAAGVLLAPLGFAGGFVLALVHCAAVGSYLAMVEVGITERRGLQFSEIQGSLGTYLNDVLSVLWIFFLAQIVVVWVLNLNQVWMILMLVSFFLFNPVPELIYQGNSRGLELLKDAGRYIRRSWLEWFPPQLVLLVLLGLVLPHQRAFLLQSFGPGFGFMDIGNLFFNQLIIGQLPPIRDIAAYIGTVGAVHFLLLFRGFLFKATNKGGRRLRAWQEQQRE